MKVYKKGHYTEEFTPYKICIEVDSTKDRRMLEEFFRYLDKCKGERKYVHERWFPMDSKYGDLNGFYAELKKLLIPENNDPESV